MKLIFLKWNSTIAKNDIINELDITEGLDSYKYNSIINDILIEDPMSHISIILDSPIYMIIGMEDYIITDLEGNNLKDRLPIKDEIYMIKFPSVKDLPKTKFNRYHKLQIDSFTYSDFDVSGHVVKRGKVNPELTVIIEGYFKGDQTNIAVKKYFYHDFGGFKEFYSVQTYCTTMNKRDEMLIKRLTPIVTELNKPENRYLPNQEVLNPVQFEIDINGHLTGRLYRNRHQVYSGNYEVWRERIKDIISFKLEKLPFICDPNRVSKYDTKNPISMIHGSIRSRDMEEMKSVDEYTDALVNSLSEEQY